MTDDSPTITRERAARLLGTSERHVRRLIAQGRLALEPDAHGTMVLRERVVLELAAQSREVVTQLEAATQLNCGRRTIRRMLDDGRLHAVATPGGHDRVTIASINARLTHVSSEPDTSGQIEDITGHVIDAASAGLETGLIDLGVGTSAEPAQPPRPTSQEPPTHADDLVPLLEAGWPTMSAPRAGSADTKGQTIRRPRRGARLAAVVLFLGVAVLVGLVLLSIRTGAKHATQATGVSPPTPHIFHPRDARLHHPAKTRARPTTRGGPAVLVAHAVHRPAWALPARDGTGRAAGAPSAPAGAITLPSNPWIESACADLYGAEGLC